MNVHNVPRRTARLHTIRSRLAAGVAIGPSATLILCVCVCVCVYERQSCVRACVCLR